MARKLTETMYLVEDLDRSIRFFVDHAGCRLLKKHDWGFAYLEIEPGANLGLMSRSCFAGDFGGTDDRLGPRLCFATDDLDAEIDALKSAGIAVTSPAGKKGETRAVNYYDPDGNAIFLWEDGSGALPESAS